MTSKEKLAKQKKDRRDAEAELQIEREIRKERESELKARVALALLNDTLEQKQEREEFQRKLAIYCNCPELDPDWRSLPRRNANLRAHNGGSES